MFRVPFLPRSRAPTEHRPTEPKESIHDRRDRGRGDAQLRGAVTALDALLRPAFKSIDSLADRPHSKVVRDALVTCAEHVRVACLLLEAVADTAEPHRAPHAHALDERALAARTRQHAL